jgi:hypothetical protein
MLCGPVCIIYAISCSKSQRHLILRLNCSTAVTNTPVPKTKRFRDRAEEHGSTPPRRLAYTFLLLVPRGPSPHSRRVYGEALDDFWAWCREAAPAGFTPENDSSEILTHGLISGGLRCMLSLLRMQDKGGLVRQRRLIVCLFLWMFGLFGLLRMIGNPRFEMLHGSDVVQLIASGVCFGVGFGVLFGKRKFPGE